MRPSSRSHGCIKFTVRASPPRDGRSATSFSLARRAPEKRESWRPPRRLCSAIPSRLSKSTARSNQHSHEIAKLVGSPPGYLGHRETHPLLSEEVLHQHHTEKIKVSLVLFDEVEKTSDALWNLAWDTRQGDIDARRQSQGGLFPNHDLHDQQPDRGGDPFSNDAPARLPAA
jgi:hypothetical protein